MYIIRTFLFFTLFPFFLFSQDRFEFIDSAEKTSLDFEWINNLIILKVEINNVPLNLILDTGVEQTVLINIKTPDTLSLKLVKKKYFTGVGIDNPLISGLSSAHNKINLSGKIVNNDAHIFLITDVDFHFSEHIGIPIHGFIGGELLKDYWVEIDYKRRKIHFYHSLSNRKLHKYKAYQLDIVNGKPFVEAFIQTKKESQPKKIKFLIDTGNSDALWVFSSEKLDISSDHKWIKDYFGLGFSGEVTGKRLKIHKFNFDRKLNFKNIYLALPDSIYFQSVIKKYPFDGLIGNEVLRRFKVIFNYKNQKMYLKKNRAFYYEKFLFNNTGVYLMYDGKIPVKVEKILTTFESIDRGRNSYLSTVTSVVYQYQMLDRIVIRYIRKNSPADRAGLMEGDVLLKINGESVYNYRLDELEKKFFYKNREKLTFLINRKGLTLEYKIHNIKQL